MQRRLRLFSSLILLFASLVPASTAAERRSVYEIKQAVSAEFGPVDMQSVYGFFEALEKAGLMTLRQAR